MKAAAPSKLTNGIFNIEDVKHLDGIVYARINEVPRNIEFKIKKLVTQIKKQDEKNRTELIEYAKIKSTVQGQMKTIDATAE